MEVYLLDRLGRRERVIDDFESMIWTERFSSYGDFQMRIASNQKNRALFETDQRLTINESHRVMTIDTIEDSTDDSGRILTLTGKSLEAIMESRAAMPEIGNMTDVPKWVLVGLPKTTAEDLFDHICIQGDVFPEDILPNTSISNPVFPVDTIAEPPDSVTYEITVPATLYDATKTLCDAYEMGFRLYRHLDSPNLYYNIYTGSDRTTQQTSLPAVVFSEGLDNLRKTTELKSTGLYKNVAYVLGKTGYEIVYAEGVDTSTSGFDLKVLVVNASEIDESDPLILSEKMIQRGKEELAKNQQFIAFDGELVQNSYQYESDYNLGDLVELQNFDGLVTIMRVTEQIFVSDREGDRSYPTLTVNRFIIPGTWSAWDYNQVWEDLGAAEYWEDQP